MLGLVHALRLQDKGFVMRVIVAKMRGSSTVRRLGSNQVVMSLVPACRVGRDDVSN
jgi:hypothetical protein